MTHHNAFTYLPKEKTPDVADKAAPCQRSIWDPLPMAYVLLRLPELILKIAVDVKGASTPCTWRTLVCSCMCCRSWWCADAGAPLLMMAFTKDGQLLSGLVADRDRCAGLFLEHIVQQPLLQLCD